MTGATLLNKRFQRHSFVLVTMQVPSTMLTVSPSLYIWIRVCRTSWATAKPTVHGLSGVLSVARWQLSSHDTAMWLCWQRLTKSNLSTLPLYRKVLLTKLQFKPYLQHLLPLLGHFEATNQSCILLFKFFNIWLCNSSCTIIYYGLCHQSRLRYGSPFGKKYKAWGEETWKYWGLICHLWSFVLHQSRNGKKHLAPKLQNRLQVWNLFLLWQWQIPLFSQASSLLGIISDLLLFRMVVQVTSLLVFQWFTTA